MNTLLAQEIHDKALACGYDSCGIVPLDALDFKQIIATVCGDDVCLLICENAEEAQTCFEILKKFAPPFFFND